MQVKQYSPELNPELFFLPRDTGKKRRVYKKTASGVEYYSHSEPIIVYDKPHETYVIDGGVAKRRRSAKGIQELRLYMDRVELWHYDDDNPEEPRCLSKCYLYMQVLDWDANAWVNVRFENVMPKVLDEGERFFYEYKDKGRTWQLEGYWTKGNAKSTYVAKAPGEMVRVRGTLMIFAPDEVTVNYDDFKGVDIVDDRINDYPSRGMQMRTITFGNDGQEDEITVDPYIEVTEQAAYIDVACDGYVLRFSEDDLNGEHFGFIYDPSSVGTAEWVRIGGELMSGSTYYQLGRTGNIVSLLESTPGRVVVRVHANFRDNTDTDLTNSDSVTVDFYIYPDRLMYHWTWVVSGNITIDSAVSAHRHIGWEGQAANVTNENNIAESGGSESDPGNYATVAGDYVGFISDELDMIGMHLHTNRSADFLQRAQGLTIAAWLWDNTTITAGTYTISGAWIIDSASREGSAKLYTATERLEMGDQWKDLVLSS